MANTDNAFGFRPVRHLSGAPYNGSYNLYSTITGDGTAIMIGDPVEALATGSTIDGVVYQDVGRAETGDVIVGVVVGVVPATRDSTIYREASTQRLLMVADDPDLIFEIQEDDADGTALTEDDVGLNADFVVSAGSTTTGLSGVELDRSTAAVTNTLDLKIWGFQNREDNEVGASAKWLVRINRHKFSDQVAGI